MANTKSAKKRARQTIQRTERNYKTRSQVKTAIRSAREAMDTKAKDAKAVVSAAISVAAKAHKKGILHRNTLARKASRLMKRSATKSA